MDDLVPELTAAIKRVGLLVGDELALICQSIRSLSIDESGAPMQPCRLASSASKLQVAATSENS